jgi:hypothetical protein
MGEKNESCVANEEECETIPKTAATHVCAECHASVHCSNLGGVEITPRCYTCGKKGVMVDVDDLFAEIGQLKEALAVAARALRCVSCFAPSDIQCYPPKKWGLKASGCRDESDGWCSAVELRIKLEELSRG